MIVCQFQAAMDNLLSNGQSWMKSWGGDSSHYGGEVTDTRTSSSASGGAGPLGATSFGSRSTGHPGAVRSPIVYPSAVVLRWRVVQIVCAIAALVMGAVALIEERDAANLALALPAGCITVLAAGGSIHRSRGFGGYRGDPTYPGMEAAPSLWWRLSSLSIWSVACALHLTVVVLACRALRSSSSHTVQVVAAVELSLAAVVLLAVVAVAHLDWRHRRRRSARPSSSASNSVAITVTTTVSVDLDGEQKSRILNLDGEKRSGSYND